MFTVRVLVGYNAHKLDFILTFAQPLDNLPNYFNILIIKGFPLINSV